METKESEVLTQDVSQCMADCRTLWCWLVCNASCWSKQGTWQISGWATEKAFGFWLLFFPFCQFSHLQHRKKNLQSLIAVKGCCKLLNITQVSAIVIIIGITWVLWKYENSHMWPDGLWSFTHSHKNISCLWVRLPILRHLDHVSKQSGLSWTLCCDRELQWGFPVLSAGSSPLASGSRNTRRWWDHRVGPQLNREIGGQHQFCTSRTTRKRWIGCFF